MARCALSYRRVARGACLLLGLGLGAVVCLLARGLGRRDHCIGRSIIRRVAGLLVVGTLVLGGPVVALAQSRAPQPTNLSVAVALPVELPAGVPVHQPVTASGQGIYGCYRWEAIGLPHGLHLAREETCVPGARTVTELTNFIEGTPEAVVPSIGGVFTISLEAIGASPRSPAAARAAGGGAEHVVVIPSPWKQSTLVHGYAGMTLSYVSCLVGPTCWVVGTSSQQLPAHVSPPAPGVTGLSPPKGFTYPGTFVAGLVSIKPLRLDLVREAIPMAVDDIACATVEDCVLVGSTTQGGSSHAPAVLFMGDGGSRWYAPRWTGTILGGFSGVACPSAGYCLAVGASTSGRGLIDRISLLGSVVHLGAPEVIGGGFSSVACANGSSCLAVGSSLRKIATSGEILAGSSALIEATRDGGQSWHLDQVAAPNQPGSRGKANEQPWLPTVDGPLMFGGLAGVGCAPGGSTRFCDVTWPFWGATASTSDGLHWYPNNLTVGALTWPAAVACPSPGRCFGLADRQIFVGQDVVSNATEVLETIPASPAWNWGIAAQGPSPLLDPSLVSISCPTVSSCVAVGSWRPLSQAGSPPYPLVVAPQFVLHPYFRAAPPPWAALYSWQTVALALGAVSLMVGVGELGLVGGAVFEGLDTLGLWTGVGSTAIGAMTTSPHDPIGLIAVLLGGLGLVSWVASFASLLISAADPNAT